MPITTEYNHTVCYGLTPLGSIHLWMRIGNITVRRHSCRLSLYWISP